MTAWEEFCLELRDLRGDRGATAVAAEIGVSYNTLSTWERAGRHGRLPRPGRLLQLLRYYEVQGDEATMMFDLLAAADLEGIPT